MAKGQIPAHQLKHDPLMDQYLTTRSWVKQRSQPILTGLTVVAVIAVVVALSLMFISRRERAAAEMLADAFKISEAVVANPIPPNVTGYAFTTEDEKNRRAYEAFEKAAREYPSYYADLGRYYAAVHQLSFDGAKAEATLQEIAQKDSGVGAQARFALAQRYHATGRFNEAASIYQQLQAKPSGVPSLLIDLNLARTYEAMGKSKEAVDLYFNVAKESRSSGLGTIAVTRLTTLDPTRLEQLPPPEPTSPLAGFR